MTDTTKKPDADKPSPPTPAKRRVTREELLARGWKEAPPGKGYIIPTGQRPPPRDESA